MTKSVFNILLTVSLTSLCAHADAPFTVLLCPFPKEKYKTHKSTHKNANTITELFDKSHLEGVTFQSKNK